MQSQPLSGKVKRKKKKKNFGPGPEGNRLNVGSPIGLMSVPVCTENIGYTSSNLVDLLSFRNTIFQRVKRVSEIALDYQWRPVGFPCISAKPRVRISKYPAINISVAYPSTRLRHPRVRIARRLSVYRPSPKAISETQLTYETGNPPA
jgi:hypothetical protein